MHTKAVLKHPNSYEGYPPDMINQNREILLDEFCGKDAVADRLNKLNIRYSSAQLDKITSNIKKKRSSKSLSDIELLNCV